MKLSEKKSHEEVRAERLKVDAVYLAETRKVALADAVSVAVVRYRAQHELTQSAFAELLGWKQPQVARLERGDVTPSWETLERLARASVIEVHLNSGGTEILELASA